MKRLDVVIVGAGAAGIACGRRLLSKGKCNFMIYEKGHSYEERYCPVDYGKECGKCGGSCNVISGFGGCIHYGDSVKLSVYPSGKRLYQLLGKEAYDSCQEFAEKAFFGNEQLMFEMTKGSQITSMDVKDYEISALSSKQVKKVLQDNFVYLKAHQCISLETTVKKIEKIKKGFYLTVQKENEEETVYAEKIVIATGRVGVAWWKEAIASLGIKAEPPIISLGFRFEMDKKYLVEIGKSHPDLKLRFVKEGQKFKTFCFCAGVHGGKLKCENYGDFTLLDGHILMEEDEESKFANFALLMQLKKNGERMTYEQVLLKYVMRYQTLSGNFGMPVFQNYASFKRKGTSPEENVTSLTNARWGPVWRILDEREHIAFCQVADEIFQWVMEWNGLGREETEAFEKRIHVLGIEIESLWDTVLLDKNMMTTVEGLYVIGDCAGIAQGIMPATISGIYAAERL